MEKLELTDIVEMLKNQQSQIAELAEKMNARLTEAKQLLASNSLSEKRTRELLRTMAILKDKLGTLAIKNDELNKSIVKIVEHAKQLRMQVNKDSQEG